MALAGPATPWMRRAPRIRSRNEAVRRCNPPAMRRARGAWRVEKTGCSSRHPSGTPSPDGSRSAPFPHPGLGAFGRRDPGRFAGCEGRRSNGRSGVKARSTVDGTVVPLSRTIAPGRPRRSMAASLSPSPRLAHRLWTRSSDHRLFQPVAIGIGSSHRCALGPSGDGDATAVRRRDLFGRTASKSSRGRRWVVSRRRWSAPAATGRRPRAVAPGPISDRTCKPSRCRGTRSILVCSGSPRRRGRVRSGPWASPGRPPSADRLAIACWAWGRRAAAPIPTPVSTGSAGTPSRAAAGRAGGGLPHARRRKPRPPAAGGRRSSMPIGARNPTASTSRRGRGTPKPPWACRPVSADARPPAEDGAGARARRRLRREALASRDRVVRVAMREDVAPRAQGCVSAGRASIGRCNEAGPGSDRRDNDPPDRFLILLNIRRAQTRRAWFHRQTPIPAAPSLKRRATHRKPGGCPDDPSPLGFRPPSAFGHRAGVRVAGMRAPGATVAGTVAPDIRPWPMRRIGFGPNRPRCSGSSARPGGSSRG